MVTYHIDYDTVDTSVEVSDETFECLCLWSALLATAVTTVLLARYRSFLFLPGMTSMLTWVWFAVEIIALRSPNRIIGIWVYRVCGILIPVLWFLWWFFDLSAPEDPSRGSRPPVLYTQP